MTFCTGSYSYSCSGYDYGYGGGSCDYGYSYGGCGYDAGYSYGGCGYHYDYGSSCGDYDYGYCDSHASGCGYSYDYGCGWGHDESCGAWGGGCDHDYGCGFGCGDCCGWDGWDGGDWCDADTPTEPVCKPVVTKLLTVDFNDSACAVTANDGVAAANNWSLAYDESCGYRAYADGRADGALRFDAVNVASQDKIVFKFDAQVSGCFERNDTLKLQYRADNGAWVTVETFKGHGDQLVGAETGKTIGGAEGTERFAIDTPEGAQSMEFRFVVDFGDGCERIAIDDVRINGKSTTCGVNPPPVTKSDEAGLCSNKSVTIDVLKNDADPDGGALKLIELQDEGGRYALTEGQPVTLKSGAEVTLVDGKLVYSLEGEDSFDALKVGAAAFDTFTYSVSEPGGAVSREQVTVKVCGDVADIEIVTERLPALESADIDIVSSPSFPFPQTGYNVTLDFEGTKFDGVYQGFCLDRDAPIQLNQDAAKGVSSYDDAAQSLVDKPENLDALNWLLNNKQVSDTISFKTMQDAVWSLVDDVLPESLSQAGRDLAAEALAKGEGYEPGAGDSFVMLVQHQSDIDGKAAQLFATILDFDSFAPGCDCAL